MRRRIPPLIAEIAALVAVAGFVLLGAAHPSDPGRGAADAAALAHVLALGGDLDPLCLSDAGGGGSGRDCPACTIGKAALPGPAAVATPCRFDRGAGRAPAPRSAPAWRAYLGTPPGRAPPPALI
jgi:hypothetical protein